MTVKEEFTVENCRVCINVKDWTERVAKATLDRKAALAAAALISTVNSQVECPPDAASLGRATWTFLHTMSVYYPDQPSASQQADMHSLLHSFSRFYPCTHCAEHLRAEMIRNPPQVTSRPALVAWLCNVHNEINARLGKPLFDCSKVFERWRDGPKDGSCDVLDMVL